MYFGEDVIRETVARDGFLPIVLKNSAAGAVGCGAAASDLPPS